MEKEAYQKQLRATEQAKKEELIARTQFHRDVDIKGRELREHMQKLKMIEDRVKNKERELKEEPRDKWAAGEQQ